MKRILLVDDEANLRKALKRVLEMEGFEVIEAIDGKEAIMAFKKNTIDLMITDIIMPDQEGLEIIAELKRKYKDLKIIAMSGGGKMGPSNYLEMAKKFGANLTLAKPFPPEKLLEAIKLILN